MQLCMHPKRRNILTTKHGEQVNLMEMYEGGSLGLWQLLVPVWNYNLAPWIQVYMLLNKDALDWNDFCAVLLDLTLVT